MGVSTDAVLGYGYNLGSTYKWLVREVNDYDYLDRPWAHAWDLVGQVEQLIRAESIAVTLERHCSDEYPSYLLVAFSMRAWRGRPKVLDFDQVQASIDLWDRNLARALELLQVTPLQERPQWLLASDWSE